MAVSNRGFVDRWCQQTEAQIALNHPGFSFRVIPDARECGALAKIVPKSFLILLKTGTVAGLLTYAAVHGNGTDYLSAEDMDGYIEHLVFNLLTSNVNHTILQNGGILTHGSGGFERGTNVVQQDSGFASESVSK